MLSIIALLITTPFQAFLHSHIENNSVIIIISNHMKILC